MKKNFIYTLILFFVIGSLVSCTKDFTKTVYSGPDVVEFANPGTGVLTRTVTVTAGTPLADSVLVQLVGPQRTTNTNVTFTVDPSSTILASEYTLVSPSPVVITPGTSSTWVKFRFTKPPASRTLLLNLTGGDGVQTSQNWKLFTYTVR